MFIAMFTPKAAYRYQLGNLQKSCLVNMMVEFGCGIDVYAAHELMGSLQQLKE
jgi:hypothetical protein